MFTRQGLAEGLPPYHQALKYDGPQVSRQKEKAPGKRKTPAAKEKCSQQKGKKSRQKKNSRGKRKMLAAKNKLVMTKEKAPRKTKTPATKEKC